MKHVLLALLVFLTVKHGELYLVQCDADMDCTETLIAQETDYENLIWVLPQECSLLGGIDPFKKLSVYLECQS